MVNEAWLFTFFTEHVAVTSMFYLKTLICIHFNEQESIPLGCVPPACRPCILQSPLDISMGVRSSSKQVRTGLHSWLPAVTSEGPCNGKPTMGLGWGRCFSVAWSDTSWVMVTWGAPPPRQNDWQMDRHNREHYLLHTVKITLLKTGIYIESPVLIEFSRHIQSGQCWRFCIASTFRIRWACSSLLVQF